jgi:hypothetical protein
MPGSELEPLAGRIGGAVVVWMTVDVEEETVVETEMAVTVVVTAGKVVVMIEVDVVVEADSVDDAAK